MNFREDEFCLDEFCLVHAKFYHAKFHHAKIILDRAYEGDKTRQKAAERGFVPVVPPKSNRKEPWAYDKELYKRRNEIERFFLRIKRFRKVFTRYDKLDTSYTTVVNFAMYLAR
jgi:transposase